MIETILALVQLIGIVILMMCSMLVICAIVVVILFGIFAVLGGLMDKKKPRT